ncbi:MarR family winged helix-turn-helix transcriptional regulator [Nocardia sp. XZ_19_385]|uniref:MarR family winged helix-turn-helix transcriptional regulator n=1 Tax=Nocardia sp. XZ_19_385 TaxID=2769488 RepID=UPI00188ED4D0|nr:MarR family transcriptional regulator [Nocardia sp. XZ_19_385]
MVTALSVLDTLARRGPARLTDLTETEQLTQPGITQLITRLERDGLVLRRRDPGDGRAVIVDLTEAGRRVRQTRPDTARPARARALRDFRAFVFGCRGVFGSLPPG